MKVLFKAVPRVRRQITSLFFIQKNDNLLLWFLYKSKKENYHFFSEIRQYLYSLLKSVFNGAVLKNDSFGVQSCSVVLLTVQFALVMLKRQSGTLN